jgi:NAD(P)-dependent dehydrogenase (short-subunit alcohol dehydrogenase family)
MESRQGVRVGRQSINPQYTAGLHFEGQTALVTGASRGIGREIALRLARMGTYVGGCLRRAVGTSGSDNGTTTEAYAMAASRPEESR